MLLYHASSGSYRVAEVNEQGAYLHQQYGTFSPGWSLIAFHF